MEGQITGANRRPLKYLMGERAFRVEDCGGMIHAIWVKRLFFVREICGQQNSVSFDA